MGAISQTILTTRSGPGFPDLLDGTADLVGSPSRCLQKTKPFQQPIGQGRFCQSVDNPAPFPSFHDDTMRTEHGKVLRYTRMRNLKSAAKSVDVAFATAQFFHDSDSEGVTEYTK